MNTFGGDPTIPILLQVQNHYLKLKERERGGRTAFRLRVDGKAALHELQTVLHAI